MVLPSPSGAWSDTHLLSPHRLPQTPRRQLRPMRDGSVPQRRSPDVFRWIRAKTDRQVGATRRRKAHFTRTAGRGRGTRRPCEPGTPAPRRAPKAHTGPIHRPSWRSHSAYVRARKMRRRVCRSSRRNWLGRHPIAAGNHLARNLRVATLIRIGQRIGAQPESIERTQGQRQQNQVARPRGGRGWLSHQNVVRRKSPQG